MKKGLLASYVAGITDFAHGESYSAILGYFYPEFITALLLYSMPFWLDAYFISHLQSTQAYATLGITNNLLHLVVKVAEAFAVSTIVLSGQFNGLGDYKHAGRALRDAFWVTCIIGVVIASFLYFGAHSIYAWYGVEQEIISLGVPFLRLRAIGIFFTFISFAFIGFLRGIKNTVTPMQVFMLGTVVFIFFDYALIFGKFGFPSMGLQGSAMASVIQYVVIFVAIISYALFNKTVRQYHIELFSVLRDTSYIKHLLSISWPIILDKAALAAAYIWLCKMIAPMGTCAMASFCVVKDMERFAFLPAVAFAQVITFLVSNDFGLQNWEGIKSNIKKVIFLTSCLVFSLLALFSLCPKYIIHFFDKKGDFTELAAYAFPILSVLVFFDLLQLILSGALRGAANVRVVMFIRLIVCLLYFFPVSYILSHLNIHDYTLKFILIYGSFYIGNALMSIAYINRFRGDDWKIRLI